MSKKIIYITVFVVLLISILAYVYFNIESKSQSVEQVYSKITLFAVDSQNNKIATGYKIFGMVPREGTTTKFGDTLDQAVINDTIKIESYNINDQNYYTYVSPSLTILPNLTYRVKMTLLKPQRLILSHTGVLKNNTFNFTLTSQYYRDPIYCIKWSSHIIRVVTTSQLITTPIEYSKYDKCFEVGKDIVGSEVVVFNVTTFGDLDEKDYIDIVVNDRDLIQNTKYLTYNNKDIGGEEVTYKILSY